MEELSLYRAALVAASIFSAAFAVWTFRLSPQNLSKFEPWPRLKTPGMILGWIALLICVPHAEVIVPAAFLPLLWPLAILVPILGFFYVDYPFARAFGGCVILGAYYLVHKSFELHTPGAPFLAVLGWVTGLAGIWISGKPCSLRDWIRLCAGKPLWRNCSAGFLTVTALALLAGAFLTAGN